MNPSIRHPAARAGFTLVELLVVVAIIVALLALLMPALGRATAVAQTAVCGSNQRQVFTAWFGYAADNRGMFCGPSTGTVYVQYSWPWDWVNNENDNIPETENDLRTGALYPYMKAIGVYRCPADTRGETAYIRSYSLSDTLGGKNFYYTSVYSLREVRQTSRTLLIVDENDHRGFNAGSYVGAIAPGPNWVDVPGPWHLNGTNIGFTDGHVIRYGFEDRASATLTIGQPAPNSPDLLYFQRILHPDAH